MNNLTTSQWAALSPVASYIVGTTFFTTLETFNIWEQHRVYPSEEELKRNKVSRSAVITHAVCYHSVTTALALVFVKMLPPLQECSDCFGSYAYCHSSLSKLLAIEDDAPTRLMVMAWLVRLLYLGVRQFIAFFIFDTWLYWTHLFSHRNRWWFSRFQSRGLGHTMKASTDRNVRRAFPLEAPRALQFVLVWVRLQSPCRKSVLRHCRLATCFWDSAIDRR